MRKLLWIGRIVVLAVLVCPIESPADGPQDDDNSWTAEFTVETGELSTTGRNPYFILEPGYQLVLEGQRLLGELAL